MNEPGAIELTAQEYLEWESRQATKSELHHGFVVAFAGGTLGHNLLARRVGNVLAAIFPSPCVVFASDVKVKISADMFFYPDVGVVCDEVDQKALFVERPRVVVEVLSPSTRGYDSIEKRAAYRSLASLEAYIIVHTDVRRIEVDARRSSEIWQTSLYHELDVLPLGGGVTPVAELYGPYGPP